jgi:hypothetical protein
MKVPLGRGRGRGRWRGSGRGSVGEGENEGSRAVWPPQPRPSRPPPCLYARAHAPPDRAPKQFSTTHVLLMGVLVHGSRAACGPRLPPRCTGCQLLIFSLFSCALLPGGWFCAVPFSELAPPRNPWATASLGHTLGVLSNGSRLAC